MSIQPTKTVISEELARAACDSLRPQADKLPPSKDEAPSITLTPTPDVEKVKSNFKLVSYVYIKGSGMVSDIH